MPSLADIGQCQLASRKASRRTVLALGKGAATAVAGRVNRSTRHFAHGLQCREVRRQPSLVDPVREVRPPESVHRPVARTSTHSMCRCCSGLDRPASARWWHSQLLERLQLPAVHRRHCCLGRKPARPGVHLGQSRGPVRRGLCRRVASGWECAGIGVLLPQYLACWPCHATYVRWRRAANHVGGR